MGRKRPLSSKSSKKQHSSKESFKLKFRRISDSKEYAYERINLLEDGSSDEPVNTTFISYKTNSSYSRASGEDNKKPPKKLEEDRQRSLSTKSLETQNSSKERLKITLRCTSISKENAHKGLNLSKDSVSDENLNTTSYSRVSAAENRHKKVPKKLKKDQQWIPSANSLEKRHSSLKNVEETSLRTRSSTRNAYKIIDYYEASSSDELQNSNASTIQDDTLSPLKLLSDKKETRKNYQRLPVWKEISSDDSYDFSVEFDRDLNTKDYDLSEYGAKDNDLLEADKAPSAPESLSNKADQAEDFAPLLAYCGKDASKSNETLRQSEDAQDDSIYSSVASSESQHKETRHSLKLLSGKNKASTDCQRIPDLKKSYSDYLDFCIFGSKDDSSVDFNLDLSQEDSDLLKFVAKYNDPLNADKAPSAPETLSNKTDLSENFTPFRYWGKGAFKANETLRQSEGDEEHKKKDASAHITPTSEKSYNLKKEWEKFRAKAALREQLENKKELSKSKIDADKKSEFGAKENHLLNGDKDLSAPETLSIKAYLSEKFTPFCYWGKDVSKANETLRQCEGDVEHKKKDASAHITPTPGKNIDPKKDWERFRIQAALRKQLENKRELSKGKIDVDKKKNQLNYKTLNENTPFFPISSEIFSGVCEK